MHGTTGVPVSLSGVGGLVTLAPSEVVPEGASPRTYDMDHDVGVAHTRAGLTNQYPVVNETVGPNAPTVAVSTTWNEPNNIFADNGSFTSQTPVSELNAITCTGYTLDVPPTSGIPGILLTMTGFANAPCNVDAQLTSNGVRIGIVMSIAAPVGSSATFTLGGTLNNWGVVLSPAEINSTTFGIAINSSPTTFPLTSLFLSSATLTLGISTGTANFQFITTFVGQNGDVKNFSMDADGNFFVENVTTAPGVQTLLTEGITAGSYMVGVNGPDVEYLAVTNLTSGADQPMQVAPAWIDRITQVGPAVAPVFAPAIGTTNTFAITSITQPPPNSDITDPGHLSVLQQSAGPTSTAPGFVLTVFYSPSFFSGAPQPSAQDTLLVNSFDAGNAVYVFISGAPFGNGTFLVTSVGNALPPGVDHERYYFTVNLPTSSFQQIVEAAGQYQMTVATMTTAVPVPGLTVGNDITIAGASVAAWDGTFPISQTLNSAALAITATSVTDSIATYDYSVVSVGGTPPVAGQLVTITNTTNANGALNGTNLTIATSTGGTTGSFTIPVSVVTAPSVPEDAQATTAGTEFDFDPGVNTVGTTTSPIFGNSTGGTLTFLAATAQLIGAGTRQGSMFFITRNGYFTQPAPPVTFSCPENTTSIEVSQMLIGPPDVIARGIILTEAGQNGVPGANFFTLPTNVTYIANNLSYTATAFFIQDNTSTTASLSFTDAVLLSALAVDVYAFNLFNNIEIGDPGWIAQYSTRNAYGLCLNKVQNFNNLSFDGGFLPATIPTGGTVPATVPAGWSQPDIFGSLITSSKFGNAYHIQNTSDAVLAVAGLISQTAFQDAFLVPIINPNTAYSVRVVASIPSGLTDGSLQLVFTANSVGFGSFTLPFASMSTEFEIFTSTLLTTEFTTVPTTLVLNVQAINLGVGADVAIDRIDIFPTAIPVLTNTVLFSYAGTPEQVDAVTGPVVFASENQQPVNGGMVLYDTFYGLKGWYGNAPGSSLYSLQASSGLEPAQWQEPEVAQKSGGAIGPLAFDLGEQWFLGASRQGLYLFEGGQPGKIMQEIYQVWDNINWAAGRTICVRVDTTKRKIFVAVPLPTPNFWLPNAPVNAAPESPNVILMCNYQGIDSGQELKTSPQMHTTMFGTLNAIDMRRKWSIWQIPTPYLNICQGAEDEELFICNGRGNSKIYTLDDAATKDDGLTIDSLYTTAGLPELSKRAAMQQLGNNQVTWNYATMALQSSGNVGVTLYPNRLLFPLPEGYNANPALNMSPYRTWPVPGGLTPGNPAFFDAETDMNFTATRTFVEFRQNDGLGGFSLSNLTLLGQKSVWQAMRGRTGV
jgi:hypothetical protein